MARSDHHRPISLRARLAIVACVFLTFVLVAAGLSALMVRAWNRTLEQRAEVRIASDEVSELRLAYSDQETGIRGYLLAGEVEFLEPYRDGTVLARRNLSRLRDRDLGARTGPLRRQIDAIEAAADSWTAAVARPALADPTTRPDEELSQTTFERLRAELDDLDRLVTSELERLIDRTNRVQRNTFGVLTASALAAIIGTALVTVLFRRWVIVPLALISDSARRVADDGETTLPDFDAPELQDVTDAISLLQHSLVGARDRAVTAYEGLEQSALLALQVRSELANQLGELPNGWEVDSLLEPAEGLVAGDCYDVGLLDRRRCYAVLVDVTGHGGTAALDALKAKSQLRAALRSRLTPGGALDWLARENQDDAGAAMLTAIAVVIDLETGDCQYANAGHPPALLTDGAEQRELPPTGPLVGAFRSTWQTEKFTIPPESTLFMYTDGVTDTIGPNRERFGETRLRDAVGDGGARSVIVAVQHAVESFRAGPRSDDTTMLVIRRGPVDSPADVPDTVLP